MGYTGPYSLGARCLTEFIADVIFVFVGEGVFANALLNKTKGNAMGYLAMVLGFAGASAFPIIMLGYISAWGNPCIVLGLWVVGSIGGKDFIAIACCQVFGCFVGACLMWWVYLPHFKTVPEPPPVALEEQLLRSTDYSSEPVLKYSSYSTQPRARTASAIRDVAFYVSPLAYIRRQSVNEPQEAEIACAASPCSQLATVQNERKLLHLREVLRSRVKGSQLDSLKQLEEGGEHASEQARLCAVYEAAIVADQNAKLSVFATRPAIFSPIFNWSVEFLGTMGIVFGGLFIAVNAGNLVPKDELPAFPLMAGIYIGMMLTIYGLGVGGPTGLAGNPARDLGPRLAHWILPISGKGSSEWDYAWIPFTGSFCGGLAGAWLYVLIRKLDKY